MVQGRLHDAEVIGVVEERLIPRDVRKSLAVSANQGRDDGELAVIDLDKARGKGENGETIQDLLDITPCRVGGEKMLKLIDAPKWEQPLIDELSAAMRDASICGLGQAAPNPVQSAMRFFAEDVT